MKMKEIKVVTEKLVRGDHGSGGDYGLFQRLVDLDTALQYFGQEFRQINAFLFGLTGEILPHAPLDGGGHQDLRVRRDVMEAANTFAEVDFGRHVVIFDRLIVHRR